MNARGIAPLVATAALLAGCSGSVPGTGGADSAGTATTTTADSPLPPRPREIRIDDLDPCAVLTPAQLDDLDIGGPQFFADDGRGGPVCQWNHGPEEPVEGVLAQRVTGSSAEAALGAARGARVVSVAGYPAVETQTDLQLTDRGCVILVDVADGQNLFVGYNYNGTEVPMTRELACEKAHAAAEMAMQTLIARAGG